MMRVLSPLGRGKRAVSPIIAYVLLVAITVALSVLVYNWLRFYAGEGGGEELECPEGVNLVIESYECSESGKYLNITLGNRGRFTVDGYILRVHDREDAQIGLYALHEGGPPILPGDDVNELFSFDLVEGTNLNTITFIEVQPFVREGEYNVICNAVSTQTVEDCSQ